MDRKDTYAVGFGGDDTSRAVFFFRVRGAPVPVHRQSGVHSGFMIVVWQTQSRAGSTVGFSCSQLQLRSSLWFRSQSL